MSIYKEASKQKLRFQTPVGNLSVEQLWDLSIENLDTMAVALEEEHAKSGKKSFVAKKTEKDKTTKLKFDIVLDILTTKVEEQDVATQKAEDKKHNEKILAIIADKKDKSLEGKSIKQLEEMLR